VVRAPFEGVAPTLVERNLGVYIWFLADPDGWIVRYNPGATLTAAMAGYVSNDAAAVLQERFPTSRYTFVQDFSGLVGYETGARKIYVDWGTRIRDRIERTILVPPPMNPMMKMGVSAGILALRLAGVTIETQATVELAIARYRLQPAR
jgi:hypothetical protein